MTDTGTTPRLMSRIRSGMPIFAFTPNPRTQRRVMLYRGVRPVPFDSAEFANEQVNQEAVAMLENRGLVAVGDRIILTKGDFATAHAGTTTIKVVEVGGSYR